jgi:hypothetical protein
MSNDTLTHTFAIKPPSLSTGRDFVDGVLNVGGFGEGESGGTDNNMVL